MLIVEWVEALKYYEYDCCTPSEINEIGKKIVGAELYSKLVFHHQHCHQINWCQKFS
jgi:hypothetical protein